MRGLRQSVFFSLLERKETKDRFVVTNLISLPQGGAISFMTTEKQKEKQKWIKKTKGKIERGKGALIQALPNFLNNNNIYYIYYI